MDMPLAYRILNMERIRPKPSPDFMSIDRSLVDAHLDLEAAEIGRAPKFRLDNVSDYYAAHDRREWSFDDFPNVAPPFPRFFTEWNVLGFLHTDGSDERLTPGQCGLFVRAMTIGDEHRSDPSLVQEFIFRDWGTRLPEDELIVNLAASAWLLNVSLWRTLGVKPLLGRPMWTGLVYQLFITAEGKIAAAGVGGISINDDVETFAPDGFIKHNPVWEPVHILGLGLSFCHCKNVKVSEGRAPGDATWVGGKNRVPTLRFHTIDINPMKEVLRHEGRSEETGLKKALHICRGHFATYSPEHPLFGKYVGTFWRPDHVRGSTEQGTVISDYSVKPVTP